MLSLKTVSIVYWQIKIEDDGTFAIHPDKILYSATSENGAVLYVCDWAILVFVWEYVCVSADPTTWRDSHRSRRHVKGLRRVRLQETSHETSSKTAGGLVIWPQESFIRMYSRTMGGVIEYICVYVYLLTYWELLEYMKETQFPPNSNSLLSMTWDGEHFIGFSFVLFKMMRFGLEPHLQLKWNGHPPQVSPIFALEESIVN